MDPLEDDSSRRSSIRFSSTIGRRVYDPETESTPSSVNENSLSETSNENVFRAPLLPSSCLKKKHEPKSPLKEKNQGNVQLTISPGTTATEDKKAAMLKRLEKRRSSNHIKWAKEKEASQVLDMSATERSFLEQAEVPEPRFSDISCITPSDTFIMTTPRRSQGPVCSTPFKEPAPLKTSRRRSSFQQPSVSNSTLLLNQSEIYESAEDIADRQFNALSVWCNMLLNTCNRFDDGTVDLGRTKQDASKRLQELLSKQTKATTTEQPQKFTYRDFLQRQEFETLRTRAMKVYRAKEVPQRIITMLQNDALSVRDGFNVYSDLSLKTTLLAIFLSFHPVWLHLGMETVFGRAIDVPNGGSFLSTMTTFINTRVFSDPEIMRKKKYAVGTVKMIVTPVGREALHRHFLTKMCQFLYCVEECKAAGVISSDPRLFVRKSVFKCLNDVFSELSREVLSASGSSMHKVFSKIGFTPSIKQGYFDDLEYRIKAITDLYDGVMLGKLLEVVCGLGRGTVMCKLRNPGGDRLRKVNNVTNVIEQAVKAGIDCGNVKPESIVGGNKEAILELMWRLVGVFVLASDSNSEELRRESLRLHLTTGLQPTAGEKQGPEDFLLRMCQRLGIELGIMVNSLDDLRDGRFLAALWNAYNPHACDVYSYPGSSLFKKVVAAAESELGLPVGLHGSLPLFVHMFLTRIFNIRRLNEAATRIQKAYRSHRFFRQLRAHLVSEEWRREKEERTRRLSLLQLTYVVCDETFQVVGRTSEERTGGGKTDPHLTNGEIQVENSFHDYEDREAGKTAMLRIMEEQKQKAAVTIQTAIRGYLARRLFGRLCRERDEYIRKVVVVQNLVRGFLARRHLMRLRDEFHERRSKSAVVIQKAYRIHAAKRTLQELKEQRRRFVHAVVLVQTCIRGFLARRRVAHLREWKREAEERQRQFEEMLKQAEEERKRLEEERRLQEEREEQLRQLEELKRQAEERQRQEEEEQKRRFLAVLVKLQALVRGFLARRQFDKMKEEKRLAEERRLEEERRRQEEEERQRRLEEERRRVLEELERLREEQRRQEEERQRKMVEKRRRREAAAVTIQNLVRGFLARRHLKRLRDELHERRNMSAIVIQQAYRMHSAKKTLQELKEQRRRFIHAVVLVQSVVRAFLARRLFYQLKEEKREEDERQMWIEWERRQEEERQQRKELAAALRIQCHVRGFLARKRAAAIREDRQRFTENVVRVQSLVRGFLARNRLRSQLDDSISSLMAESPVEQPQPVIAQSPVPASPARSAATSAEIMDRLRRLYMETLKVKQRQAVCAQALRAMKKEADGKREAKLRSSSATKIQAAWRGFRVRKRLAKEIESRQELMNIYTQEAASQEEIGQDGRAMPAFRRLETMEKQLFDDSLYRVKVAATVIGRIISLSPMLGRHFVLECSGVNALLDRLEMCDRSPPMQEIIGLTLKAFLSIAQLAQSDLEVAAVIQSTADDCQAVVFHQFHAFYQDEAIVVDCAKILTDIRRIATDAVHKKAPFYLNQAERRFARLADNDPRKTALRSLQAVFR